MVAALVFPGPAGQFGLPAPRPAPVLATDPTAPPAPTESGPELFRDDGFVTQGAPAQPDFTEDVVLDGLVEPVAVEFASNGHVLVAEKRGAIKEFNAFGDTTYLLWADFRAKVHNYWDRGLLGMALHPNFPATNKIYVAYTHDAAIGGTAPTWGTSISNSDGCPNPPGGQAYGCMVSSRLSVLTRSSGGTVTEQVLVEDWCQQYPSHSISDVVFGPDGYLYVGHGDGASFNYSDYGQQNASVPPDPDWPNNPCGDPPGGVGGTMEMPTAEGGSLRSQDIRTSGDPLGLDGTIIRIDPNTGAGVSGNPLFGNADPNAKRIIANGFRNPFRITFRPGTSELWLGDVGQNAVEEVNRISDTTPASVLNYGWPCREGNQAGPAPFPTANICAGVTGVAPHFSYTHGAAVSSPDCSPFGSSASIAGIAFYEGGNYPALYDDALFIADYSRDCIWALPAGSNGLPDGSAVFKFADASNPVQLKIGPGGDLYYLDYDPFNPSQGKLRRISYQAPVARISADPTSGPEPLTVDFDGTASTTPAPPLSYAWDLDGDGQFDDSTSPTPSRTYTSPGLVTVRLRVTDGNARTDDESVVIDVGQNDSPVPTIGSPSASFTWAVGDLVSFSGSATDDEDGTIPAADLDWSLVLHHCPSDCHQHVIQTWDGTSGASFSAPDHEYPSHLELRLTATDSGGKQATASRILQPKTSTVTLETSPAGLSLSFAGKTKSTPFQATVIRGSASTLVAPTTQVMGGVTYAFDRWTHGGLSSQDVLVTGSSASFEALYVPTYSDVAGSPFLTEIQWASQAGITVGCGGGKFCPTAVVTREQMASFLVRALGLTAGASPDQFSDIAGSGHRDDINRLATAGITGGCGNGKFCPTAVVTREQMASFLVRAFAYSAGATPDKFTDIAGSQHRLDINRLATAGITGGCGGGKFCPKSAVTREQMVAFLYRALE